MIWLPVFLAFFGMVVDTSMVFSNRSLALKVIQDANRSLALRRLPSPSAAEDYVYDRMKSILPTATVVTIENGTTIATRLSAPASEFDAIGLFGFLTGVQIAVQAQQMKES